MTNADFRQDFDAEVRAAVRFEQTMAVRASLAVGMCGLIVLLHQLLA